jgi:major membrane immunogen (membrane-anchored lipoprotein)
MKQQVAAIMIAAAILTACGKKEEAAPPAATAPAVPASAPDGKNKDDLARIRELMEKEEARKVAQEAKDKKHANSRMEGAKAPLQTFGR